jgi:hypothetical protein
MIRLPGYNTDSSGKPSNTSVNDLDSQVTVTCGKISKELSSSIRNYVTSTVDDFFADETTPILPKYDGHEHDDMRKNTSAHAIPHEDAPEYESPDEGALFHNGHL